MTAIRRIRRAAGALVRDWPVYEWRLRSDRWLEIRNRNEIIDSDGRGIRCRWRFTSDLHLADVFRCTGRRLLSRSLAQWRISFGDAGRLGSERPRVSFLIGHRGLERLPHLLSTLRSIAGQRGVPIECIVVEQADRSEIGPLLPAWVRHVHTPVLSGTPYNRAWAFNVGARHASSEVLVFHDGDLLVPQLYADEALSRIGEGALFLDLKRFVFYLGLHETQRVFESESMPRATPRAVTQNAQGGSIVAAASAFHAIGGFDEEFVGWGGEDNDFWDRAETTERVYSFGYLPMVHLEHPDQAGKRAEKAPAVARYRELERVDPRERIGALLRRGERP